VGAISADGAPTGGAQPAAPTGGAQRAAPTGGAQRAAPTGGAQRAAPTGGAQPATPTQARGRRRAAGIYGTIITAAIFAAAGAHLPTVPLAVSVVVTLLVYWVAEEYAELLGEQVEGGCLPTWPHIRAALAATWPMVTASYLPLLALVLTSVAGASISAAANCGLAVAVVLLVIHAWSAGRASHLRGRQLLVITSVAALLGIMMVLLKDVVLIYLH